MNKVKTILTTTYAVHPTKGSEDAMGWNYVLQIARKNKVVSITRKNNRSAIEQFMAAHPSPLHKNITFLYFDLPYWMRFWKRGSKGALLYYWMWQRAIPRFVQKQNIKFDIVHNLNFHNDWTPSYLWKLNKPFVWGPIGHHPLIPEQYLKPYSKQYLLKDRLTWLVKSYFWKYSIALNNTAKKADFIYAMNSSVGEKIALKPQKHIVKPSIATQDFGFEINNNEEFTLISAGRFVPLKGFDLTLLSFAKFLKSLPKNARKQCKLVLVGKGPEEDFLKQLIKQEEIGSYVEIIPWIERNDLMQKMKNASAFLFPSHEGAGMVVAEALSFALPVICLKNCGPGEFVNPSCGFAVPEQEYDATVENLAQSILALYSNPKLHQKMRLAARSQFQDVFHWDRRGEWLAEIYAQL